MGMGLKMAQGKFFSISLEMTWTTPMEDDNRRTSGVTGMNVAQTTRWQHHYGPHRLHTDATVTHTWQPANVPRHPMYSHHFYVTPSLQYPLCTLPPFRQHYHHPQRT
jgi:hypothetical protein